jgi:hypothetical protein
MPFTTALQEEHNHGDALAHVMRVEGPIKTTTTQEVER